MINIVSPINQLGYGVTGLNIVKSLAEVTDVSLWVIGQPSVTNETDAQIISKCIKNAQYTVFNAPCIKIWHQHDMTQFAGTGQRIGFPIFELDKFNALEKHHLSSLDKIFVCSQWAKNIVANNIKINPDNIYVINLGVDRSIFKTSTMPECNTTRFFNCGKWEIRKGHDVLVEIFNEAFNPEDDVELILMCDNPFCTKEEKSNWENLYLKSRLGNKITIIPRQNTQQEVYSVMSQTHCGIFPSRAEGWNLELLEMMACGKHVIATNYAAHTEFCTNYNSMLVDINDEQPAVDNKWFFGQGNWARISDKQKEQFINYMREIHQKRKSGNLKLNSDGVQTAENLNWSNSAKQILKSVA